MRLSLKTVDVAVIASAATEELGHKMGAANEKWKNHAGTCAPSHSATASPGNHGSDHNPAKKLAPYAIRSRSLGCSKSGILLAPESWN